MRQQFIQVFLIVVNGLIPSLLCGQNPSTIDSLTTLLDQSSDSIRITIYQELANQLAASDSASAVTYIQKGLTLATQLSDEEAIWTFKVIRGDILWRKGYYDQARAHCQQILSEVEQRDFKQITAKCLLTIAITYDIQGYVEEALIHYDQSLVLYQHLKNQKGIAAVYLNKGIYYQYLGNYSQSINCYQKALEGYQTIGNQQGVSNTYQNIGNIYRLQNNYAQSIEYYQKALTILKKIEYQYGMGAVLNNIAGIYEVQGNYNKAHDCYQQALQVFEAIDDQTNLLQVLNNIGNLYQLQHNDEAALLPLSRGMALAISLNNPKDIATFAYTLGVVYLHQEQKDSAFHYFNQSFTIHKEVGNLTQLREELRQIGKWYTFRAKIPQALDFYYDALQISEEAQDTLGKAEIHLALADLHQDQDETEKALSYYQEALMAFQRITQTSKVAQTQLEIARLYVNKNVESKALHYAVASLNKFQQLQDSCQLSEAMIYTGKAYELLQKRDSALFYLQKAIPKTIECHYYFATSDSYISIGRIYQEQGNRQYAFRAFEQALDYAKQSDNRAIIKEAAAYLYPVYETRGQLAKALTTFKIFHANSDSVFNQANTRKLAQRELQYTYEKEQVERALIQQQKDAEQEQKLIRQRWVSYSFVGGFIAMVLIALAVYRNYRNKQKANALLQEQNEEIVSQRDHILEQREELETSYEKLKKLARMKRALTGMIAHDLKNPLSFIRQATSQDRIKQAAQQMLNMVLNMLDTQKMEEAQLKPDMKALAPRQLLIDVKEQVDFLANQRNIQLHFEVIPTVQHAVVADKELTTRILVNLLTNAIKFSAVNTTVSVVVMPSSAHQAFIRFVITDQGQGIPADKRATLFNQFSQIEARTSGGVRATGIGLSFCKLATEAQNGRIGIESEVGIGTSFWVDLPQSGQEIIIENTRKVTDSLTTSSNIVQDTLDLDEVHQAELRPYLQRLQVVEVYDYSEIVAILEEIKTENVVLQQWKLQMQLVIESCNETRYMQLIKNGG